MPDECDSFIKSFSEQVDGQFMLNQLKIFANGESRRAGDPYNRKLADMIEIDWRDWGIPIVKRDLFYPRLPLGPDDGKVNQVEVLDSNTGRVLHEAINSVIIPDEVVEGELDGNAGRSIPLYNAYSSSGSVTGQYVYLNYARPSDLEAFDEAQLQSKPSPLCSHNTVVIACLGLSNRQSKVNALLKHCSCGESGRPLAGHHVGALLLANEGFPNANFYPNGPDPPPNGDAQFGHVGHTVYKNFLPLSSRWKI